MAVWVGMSRFVRGVIGGSTRSRVTLAMQMPFGTFGQTSVVREHAPGKFWTYVGLCFQREFYGTFGHLRVTFTRAFHL